MDKFGYSYFMTISMFNLREVIVPGLIYIKKNTVINGQFNYPQGAVPLALFSQTYDPISYIYQIAINLLVSIDVFINMAVVSPRFYNQRQQAMQDRQ